jgi:L-aminopeptidase/D-esterase-like protein
MATERATFAVGHWTDQVARTGCTVILFDRLVPAVVDVCGGAPGTRETDLLAADRLVGSVDAILFAGGSAHGLAAADGVMQYLRERSRGFPTSAGPVPIVTAAVIYDLAVGSVEWPTAQSGFAACEARQALGSSGFGSVGAGTGATIAKIYPDGRTRAGGYGWHTVDLKGDLRVHALVVVNAVGDVVGVDWIDQRDTLLEQPRQLDERSATTLAAIIIDGYCDARTLRRVSMAAHDGMARAIVPCHTLWDGDVVYAAQTGTSADLPVDQSLRIAIAAELAIERAIRAAVSG